MPARREELLAGQPPRVRAGQEDRDSRDVSRLPDAAQRSLRGRVLLEGGADEARRRESERSGPLRVHGLPRARGAVLRRRDPQADPQAVEARRRYRDARLAEMTLAA